MTRVNGTLHEDRYAFFIISLAFLLRMRNVSDKRCRETENKHFVLSNFFFENRAVYEKMWGEKNIVDRGRPKMTIWRMRIASWIPKAANTHTHKNVILIAWPPQQWLHKRAPMLRL